MDIELNRETQSFSNDVPLLAHVGRRRNPKRALSGAITVRPMTDDVEVRLKAALQRVVSAMVQRHLQGDKEIENG